MWGTGGSHADPELALSMNTICWRWQWPEFMATAASALRSLSLLQKREIVSILFTILLFILDFSNSFYSGLFWTTTWNIPLRDTDNNLESHAYLHTNFAFNSTFIDQSNSYLKPETLNLKSQKIHVKNSCLDSKSNIQSVHLRPNQITLCTEQLRKNRYPNPYPWKQ